MATDGLVFKVTEKWAQTHRENPWLAFVPEFAEKDGQTYMRGVGRTVVYRTPKEGSKEGSKETYCICDNCGSKVKAAIVAHSVWDGPFPCSGSGECQHEEVPYCPNCEKQPNPHSTPITS